MWILNFVGLHVEVTYSNARLLSMTINFTVNIVFTSWSVIVNWQFVMSLDYHSYVYLVTFIVIIVYIFASL